MADIELGENVDKQKTAASQAGAENSASALNVQPVEAGGAPAKDQNPKQESLEGSNSLAYASLVSAVSRYFSNPVSESALLSGLPLPESVPQESHIPELAKRASLRCVRRSASLDQLDYLQLPALLIMQNDNPLVLLKCSEEIAEVITPAAGQIQISLDELQAGFQGRYYILQPDLDREISANAGSPKGHWFWRLAFSQRKIYTEAAFGSIAVNILALALPLFIMAVYDRVIPNFATESLMVLLTGMLLVATIDFALRYMRARAIDAGGKAIDTYLGNQTFAHMLWARLGKLGSSGATANSIRELDVIRDFLSSATLVLISDLPFVGLFVLAIYLVGGSLVWVPLIAIPSLIIILCLSQIPLFRLTEKAYANASNRNSVLFETLNGLESIKAMGAESWAALRWEKAHAAGVKTAFASRFYGQINQNIITTLQTLSTLAIISIGVFLIRDGSLSFGALFAVVILNGRVVAPISQVAQLIGKIHGLCIAYREIDSLMNKPLERDAFNAGSEDLQLEGNIDLDRASFAYHIPEVSEDLNIKVLDEVGFSIKAGEKVGLVGTIGSGKSTLLKLLLNLISVQEGTIRLEGVDSRELDSAALRDQIGYMPQNPHFFSGTLKDNLTMAKPWVTEVQISEALRLSGVEAWMASCPLGLSQPIGERGDYLSGGQRQSLALARALLGNPKLLLLDEPTSLLDSQAEANFVTQMKSIAEGKTLLVTTHRPAMLALVDRLIVLDRGKVVLDGDKEEVLARLSGAS